MRKLIIFLFFINFSFAGDGTLPVLNTVNIEFERIDFNEVVRLPNCLNLKVSARDIKQNSIVKEFDYVPAGLNQKLKIKAINERVKVEVDTNIKGMGQFRSNLRAYGPMEYYHEAESDKGSMVQAIRLNYRPENCIDVD